MKKKPDYHFHEEFQNRERKLQEIRAAGIDPYPHSFKPTASLLEISKEYESAAQSAALGSSEDAEHGKTPVATVAGRLVLFRAMGKNAFAHLQGDSGRLQVMFNRDNTKVEGYNDDAQSPLKWIEKKIDLGDILGVEGHLFRTQKGELTLYAKKVTLLSKTLLPLAEKHAGLSDKELRYRKRWLDLISNPEVTEIFLARSQIFETIREFLKKERFLEVETPVLQSIYGGAEARPFETHLHAMDQDMFLRISLEIPLKKLIIGGLPRIFEIGRVFRNEGIDRNHNPEFTLLEAYGAYLDYNDMMSLVERLFETIALKLFGKTQVPALHPETGEPIELEMKAPWKRLSMKDSLKTYAQLDVEQLDDEKMKSLLKESGRCDKVPTSRGLLIAALFETFVEPHLVQPHHIIDHPIETTPLCKPHRDPAKRKEGLVERFESFVLCQEISNAYTELNDPEMQRQLLEVQAERKERGDVEASPLDEEFLEAICQGMPPTGGVGIGLDRLVMLMTQAKTIRDVLFFPWMRPN